MLEQTPHAPKQKPTDDLHHRWMHENGTMKDASITDYFAAHALIGLLSSGEVSNILVVEKAYDIAEAMVSERSRRYPK